MVIKIFVVLKKYDEISFHLTISTVWYISCTMMSPVVDITLKETNTDMCIYNPVKVLR